MKIESKLIARIVIWKAIWLIFWLIAFLIIPSIFAQADLFLRFWVWLWYITLWALIWIFWVMNNYPFLNIPIPFWIRWIFLWWWMNFILCLFAYNNLTVMMQNSIFKWYSPFRIVVEWMIFWLLTDYIATKFAWDWDCTVK